MEHIIEENLIHEAIKSTERTHEGFEISPRTSRRDHCRTF